MINIIKKLWKRVIFYHNFKIDHLSFYYYLIPTTTLTLSILPIAIANLTNIDAKCFAVNFSYYVI